LSTKNDTTETDVKHPKNPRGWGRKNPNFHQETDDGWDRPKENFCAPSPTWGNCASIWDDDEENGNGAA